MYKKIVFPLVLLALLGSACASARSYEPAMQAPMVEEVYFEEERPVEVYDSAAPSGAYDEGGYVSYDATISSAPPTEERIVIKNADLSIAVDDPTKSMERISQLAEEYGGYVVAANLYQTYLESGIQVPQASITIRVPAGKLNDAMERIKEETSQPIISESINSQDVTAEYTDLQSRLRNLQAAETQLVEIMGAAVKTEDVLAVYSQLTAVREQIEIIQGQIQYYEQSAAMSAISVSLLTNEAVQPLTIGGWQPVGVAKDAVQALINVLKFLVNVAIWSVILIIPVGLLVFGPPILIIRALLKRRARRKAQAAPPAPQA
ncbi:MAG: DUF4349 domain-containing protein [Anaerolineales bacterium]|nr:DUF4349 domain-containing protein [Anaerolineales bacterium]